MALGTPSQSFLLLSCWRGNKILPGCHLKNRSKAGLRDLEEATVIRNKESLYVQLISFINSFGMAHAASFPHDCAAVDQNLKGDGSILIR